MCGHGKETTGRRNEKSPRADAAAVLLLLLGAVGSAAAALPGSSAWQKQAPLPTRFAIEGVDLVTASEAWAVAYTDILHTTDGGATWQAQARPGGQNLYAVDFHDDLHGIAVGNTALYTRDGGATWIEAAGTVTGYKVEMVDASLAFVTDHRVSGYFRSTDGGATWAFASMATKITSIQCFDSLNCVAASPGGVYHSYDGGLAWSFVAGQGGDFPSTHFVSHSLGWIVYGSDARKTTDGGTTWQAQTLPPGSWIYDRTFVDADHGWGVGNGLVRTTDGGATWLPLQVGPQALPLWDVDFVDASSGIAGGDSALNTDAVLLTTGDGGATWSTRSQGSINDVLDLVALDGDHAWASHDYGGKTSRTTDGGATWTVSEVGSQYLVLGGIDMADMLNGWTVGFDTTLLAGHIYHTTDGGVSWRRQLDPGADVLRAVEALDARTAIIVGGDAGSGPIRHRTTDGGATWAALTVPIASFFYDVFFLNEQIGWMVGGGGDIVKSTDGGDTWTVQSSPAPDLLATVHFSDPSNGWAGGYDGALVRTTDGGASWRLQNPQLPTSTHVLGVAAESPLRGWIAGYGGGPQSAPFVKYTIDGGASWIDHTPSVGPYDGFGSLAFVGTDQGWAAGAGGIFRHGQPCTPGRPVAGFTGTPTFGPAPLTVTFSDQSSGGPTSWTWDFGDGATSNLQNPSHTYLADGTYSVTLTATNGCGSDTATRPDYVTVGDCLPPVAELTAAPRSGPAPLAVSFTDQSSNVPTSWAWSFGDGGTSTAQNPSHTYGSAGVYTVSLTVANSCGSDGVAKPSYITVTGGTLDDEIVTGAGAGPSNAPVVRTWDHGNPPNAISTFAAYGSPQYGCNVASVDMVGGGPWEVATGPGPGAIYGPQVRGFLPAGTPIAKVSFFAYGTLRFGVHAAGGNVDGDAHGEILTSPGPGAVFGPHVRGFDHDGAGLAAIGKISFFAYSTLRYGARAAGGDVDGDWFAEIVTGAGAGAVFESHVRGFDYDGTATTALPLSLFAFGTGQYGADVGTGRTGADPDDAIIASHGPDPSSDGEVKGFDFTGTGAVFAFAFTASTSLGGAEVGAGDLDADGKDDVVVGAGWGAANPSSVEAFTVSGTGGTPMLGFTAYPAQSYGTKVAVGHTGI